MQTLSDTQAILLSAAASRPDGSLLPAPDGVKAKGAALDRVIRALLRKGLAQQYERTPNASKEGQQITITEAGLAALGLDPSSRTDASTDGPRETMAPPKGKLGTIVEMTARTEGATLAEIGDALGWLPHTARAALTRLRKRGFEIRLVSDGARKAYRLRPAA